MHVPALRTSCWRGKALSRALADGCCDIVADWCLLIVGRGLQDIQVSDSVNSVQDIVKSSITIVTAEFSSLSCD